MKRDNLTFLAFLFILVTSFASTLGIVLKNTDASYWLMALLPISFLIILLLNYRILIDIKNKMSIPLILASYYMRMVILPILFVYSNYSSLVVNQEYSGYITRAVILSIYEFLIVATCINLFKKRKPSEETEDLPHLQCAEKGNKTVRWIVYILLLTVIIAFLIFPQFKSYFHFIFETNLDTAVANSINFKQMKDSIPPIIYWLVIYIIDILQIMLPIMLINHVSKLRIKETGKFILSLLIIIPVILISTPETARSIIIPLALCVTLIKLYPKQKKKLFAIIILGLIPSILYGLIAKTRMGGSISDVSSMFNAYFSGIANISTAFLIPNTPSINYLFNDVAHSIPFVSVFFNSANTTSTAFNNVLYNSAELHDQIIPMISQSLCYFGFVFAPISSYLSAKMSIWMESKRNETANIFRKYLDSLFIIIFATAPIIYNFSILLSTVLKILIPCMLIVNFGSSKLGRIPSTKKQLEKVNR